VATERIMTKTNTILAVTILALMIIPAGVAALPSWCDRQNTIYFQQDPANPSVGQLQNYPSGLPQKDSNVTITSLSGLVLTGTYLTKEPDPSVLGFEPGLRIFSTFHYVDMDIGDTRFIFEMFLLHSDGSNTTLYSAMTNEINSITPSEYTTDYTLGDFTPVDPTDRIGISVYVNTTSTLPVTAHFLYEGTDYRSNLYDGEYTCASPIPEDQDTSYAIVFGVAGGIIGAVLISKRGSA
jgi:hypothetical protein